MESVCAIILAAGKGTRMKSPIPKVLHEFAGKPLIYWTLSLLNKLDIKRPVVVYSDKRVRAFLSKYDPIFAEEKQLLGTAYAVKVGLAKVPQKHQTIFVLYADDSFLYRPKTIKGLIEKHLAEGNNMTLLVVPQGEPLGIGALRRDEEDKPMGFYTKKEMEESGITKNEVVCGAFCFKRSWLEKSLKYIKKVASGEYLLTSLIPYSWKKESKVGVFTLKNKREWWGVNTQEDLKIAQKLKIQLLKDKNA